MQFGTNYREKLEFCGKKPDLRSLFTFCYDLSIFVELFAFL